MLRKLSKLKNLGKVVVVLLWLAAIGFGAEATQTYYIENGLLVEPSAQELYLHSEGVPCLGYQVDPSSLEIDSAVIQRQCGAGQFVSMTNVLEKSFLGTPLVEANEAGEITRLSYQHGISSQAIATAGHFYTEKPVLPASDQVTYAFNQVTDELGIIDTVYAQDSTVYNPGPGRNILQPIQSFWSVNQGLAYGLLVIVVIIVALLILFRRQSGGELITVLNSIPNIVASLVLITFSYALSGLFIDLITIGANGLQFLLVASPGAPGYNTIWNNSVILEYEDHLPNLLNLSRIEGTVEDFVERNGGPNRDEYTTAPGNTGLQIDDPLMSVWLVFGTADIQIDPADGIGTDVLPNLELLNSTPLIGGVVAGLGDLIPDGGTAETGISTLASGIINLVFGLALFMASIRIFFKLLSAYIVLMMFPIISPYIFLIAALPTQTSRMIQAFVNPMLGAALKFIVTYGVFLVIVVISYEPLLQGFSFAPPLLGYDPDNAIQTTGHTIKVLIAYGMFLSLPPLLDQVGNLSFGGDLSAFGQAISQGTRSSAGTIYGLGANLVGRYRARRYPEQ